MPISLGVVMDPIGSIKFHKDTTLAMLLAAQARGWTLHYMEPRDLFLRDGRSGGHMQPLKVWANKHRWFELGDARDRPLGELDVILMRKDPPVDMEFVYATHLLEQAERDGALVVNRAASLRDANEKLFATEFPQCAPPTLVSHREEELRAFIEEQGTAVLKPLGAMGGASVFRIAHGDPNTGVIIETLTDNGARFVMAQRYLPEITEEGDKRILLIDGEPVPYALARIPAAGEFRGNLAAGGRGVAVELSDRDRWICQQVAPVLREKGLLFVGLDVIGDHLTEINVTSPTCLRELDEAHGLDIAGEFMELIEARLAKR